MDIYKFFTNNSIESISNTKLQESILDPMFLYGISNEIMQKLTSEKYKFDKFGSFDGILGTSLSIRSKKPQVLLNPLVGDVNKKIILIVSCSDYDYIPDMVNKIREAGGIVNKVITVMNHENGVSKWCVDNGVELFSFMKESDFGII